MKRQKRPDEAYEIEALSKGIKILEALQGTNFKPVSVEIVMQRTGFPRDFCDRALKTLAIHNWVKRTENKLWMVGPKATRFSDDFNQIAIEML